MEMKSPLTDYREDHRLSQTQLARRLGLSEVSIRRMEQGTLAPSNLLPLEVVQKQEQWLSEERRAVLTDYPLPILWNLAEHPLWSWIDGNNIASINAAAKIIKIAPKSLERHVSSVTIMMPPAIEEVFRHTEYSERLAYFVDYMRDHD